MTAPESPGAARVARLRAVAIEIAALRTELVDAGEIDAFSPESPRLIAAAELVVAAVDGLESLPAPVHPEDAGTPAEAVVTKSDAATGGAPDDRGEEDESGAAGEQPVDERDALLAALRPRLYTAVADALDDLAFHELRALAAHPDATCALVLVVGLATRGKPFDL